MSRDGVPSPGAAGMLRRAFDQTFAEARRSDPVPVEDFLEIRIGAFTYALRIREISAVHADRTVTPIPTPVRELLGITNIAGVILPVYDLGALLGHPADAARRGLAIASGMPVALAFTRLEKHLRVGRDAIVPHDGAPSPVRHVREILRVEERARPIVSFASVLDAIASRVRAGGAKEER